MYKLGVTGSAFAFFGIMNHFIPFLSFLGVIIPPVAGVYIADYYFIKGKQYKTENLDSVTSYSVNAFIAWVVAAAIGYATVNGYFRLTGISSIDTIVVAFLGYLALEKFWIQKSRILKKFDDVARPG